MRKVARALRGLATVFLGVFAGFALAEVGVRLLSRADPVAQNTWARVLLTGRHAGVFHVTDPRLGWRNRAGVQTIFESPEFRVAVHINQLGMRGPAVPPRPAVGKRRVLFVGDSFVFGWGVEEDETFFAELARLRADLEPIAMGVAGYGTDQELVWLRDEGLRALAPQTVVACVYVNDLIDNVSSVRWGRPKITFRLGERGELGELQPPGASAAASGPSERPQLAGTPGALALPPAERIDDWFVSHLRLYALLRPRIATLAVRAGWLSIEEGIDDYVGYFARESSPTREAQWALLLAELDEMQRVAQRGGAELVVLAVPAKVQVQKQVRARVLRSYGLAAAAFDFGQTDRRLRDWGTRAGVRIISPRELMEREADRSDADLYYAYDGHWNRRGHRACGEALAAELPE
jgi:hypothetical protein